MEDLKPFSELLKPDERSKYFGSRNAISKEFTPFTLDDRFQSISEISLSTSAPENVRSQYNIARMLGIYAWLYYPFHQVAELKAFSTVEMPLRQRFPEVKGSLKKLLSIAIEMGIITDKGFTGIDARDDDANWYSKTLPKIMPSLRNDLAHGSFTLHPGSLFTLKNCAEIINQLYPEAK